MRLTRVTFGYFKKYVEREIAKTTQVNIYKPFQGWQTIKKRQWYWDENKPWTDAAKQKNEKGAKNTPYLLEPIAEQDWSYFKGDRVSFSLIYKY